MFLRILDRLEEILIATLMAAATFIIFRRGGASLSASAFPCSIRCCFRFNLSWAQELCIYMFVWMAKFGAAYGVRTGIHVGVDVLVNHAERRRARKQVVLFGLFCGAFFTGVSAPWAPNSSSGCMPTDQVSPDLEMPSWIVYLCIPLGSYLMCFRFLQVAWTSGAPANCRIMTTAMSRASTSKDCPASAPRRSRDEQRLHLRPADRADADRHADLDRARHDRADLHATR